mgnify:CR=1 FL=1
MTPLGLLSTLQVAPSSLEETSVLEPATVILPPLISASVVKAAADAVWGFLVQREVMGLRDRAAKARKRWTPEEGIQGSVVFIGSISSQGNRGQVSYASTKAGLEGAAATIMKEAMFYGVRCSVIHPGFTDTPMVQGRWTNADGSINGLYSAPLTHNA